LDQNLQIQIEKLPFFVYPVDLGELSHEQ